MATLGQMTGFLELIEVRHTLDSEGFETTTEHVLAKVRAYREGRHGSQWWANMSTFSEATDLFRIRAIPGIRVTTDHVISWGNGERFEITSVEDVKGRGMYVDIMAKKETPTKGA